MKLVCIGDSLTSGYKLNKEEVWPALVGKRYNMEVLNMGINGDTTAGVLSRFYRDVIDNNATHAVIMAGTNDLVWGVPLTVIQSNIAAVVMHSYQNRIMPIVGIPIPAEVHMAKKYWPFVKDLEQVNEKLKMYREWIMEFNVNFQCRTVDFYSSFYDSSSGTAKTSFYLDGLHPTVEGNEIMAGNVKL